MTGAPRVTVISRSLRASTAIWSGLRSFYTGADLVVSDDPVSRALEEPSDAETAVFALVDQAGDFEALGLLDEAPEWLVILCSPELLQRVQARLDYPAIAVPVLAVDEVHLALLGRQLFALPPRGEAPHRERL
jgi:hypothetical protein